jgi:integrase
LDYFNRTLYVESTLLDNGSESSTKTESSQRYLPLRPEVIEAFKRQEKRSRMLSEFIFPDPNTGKRYAMSNSFLKRFKILLRLAGLKLRSPDQLRHTFATLHIAAEESITWVSKMLGHSTVKMTLERYNQYVPDLTREAGSAFEKTLKVHRFGHGMGTVIDNKMK